MIKKQAIFSLLCSAILFLTGCSTADSKTANLSVIYGVSTLLAFLLLFGCFCVVRNKKPWFLVLFTSVTVVNIGYFALSVSNNLDEALFANRLAYLGSVFLPLSMLMIILSVTRIQYQKWMPVLLFCVSVIVFLIAASPGYSWIYYQEVTFSQINGVSVLNKVYGPLHFLYLVYLVGYFISMVSVIVYSTIKDKIDSTAYAVVLVIAVFVNIGVWLIEQFVRIDFEILSVSYIISELFLLGLHIVMSEAEKQKELLLKQALESMRKATESLHETGLPAPMSSQNGSITQEEIEYFVSGITHLTPKEKEIYECYTSGMSSAEVLEHLNIKENTLKFHNKNLYGKLGVKSRKQLLALHKIVASD